MTTFNLYDPANEATPILVTVQDPANVHMGCADSITSLFNPQMPFSIGCIDAGVIDNNTGQGQIYPTGRS
jgi:hypothetical protein